MRALVRPLRNGFRCGSPGRSVSGGLGARPGTPQSPKLAQNDVLWDQISDEGARLQTALPCTREHGFHGFGGYVSGPCPGHLFVPVSGTLLLHSLRACCRPVVKTYRKREHFGNPFSLKIVTFATLGHLWDTLGLRLTHGKVLGWILGLLWLGLGGNFDLF